MQTPVPEPTDLQAEITRLKKIIEVLMDRAERSTGPQDSDFSLLATTVLLEEQVRQRTADLEDALRENEKITRALSESEAKFRGLVSQSLVGIVLVDDGKFSYSNAKFDEMFGYTADEIRMLGPADTATASDREFVAQKVAEQVRGGRDQLTYVFHGLRKNGEVLDVECHSSVMHLGARPLLIGLLVDVTERTQAQRRIEALQAELREQAIHDALTGLSNRRFLDESFGRDLARAERAQEPLSVIIGDLDRFKEVNDRHGHLAGDEVLRVFAEMLTMATRSSDIACRYGGEEFLLVLPGAPLSGAVARAEQLRKQLAATVITYGEATFSVTASFGVSVFPGDGRNPDELIAAADNALYEAKASGRNRVHVAD
jgi:diguanylate cyclase (GGDEF)-like protein/PAS domain S-box-containing protein